MSAALLCIGTELTRGELDNTNATWLAAQLTELGFEVNAIEVVADDQATIAACLRRLAKGRKVIITTGGLGPTSDDLTAESVAEAAGVSLEQNPQALRDIQRFFEQFGREMSPSNARQADIPAGATMLRNKMGTAPGFALRLGDAWVASLPGVPREMKHLFHEHLVEKLRPLAPQDSYQIRLRSFGLPESQVADKLSDLEAKFTGLTLGYRASFPEIEIKLLCKGDSAVSARQVALDAAAVVQSRLGDVIYGEDDVAFPEAVGRALRARGWLFSVAESCTGGLVAHMITRYPSSDYFIGGAVTYANSSKTRLVHVSEDLLKAHGAVSPESAAAMAEGLRRACDVDIALAITGIAGPTGGTPEKPVGLVYWAIAHPGGTVVKSKVLPGDRNRIQTLAAFIGLSHVRRICLEDDRGSQALKAAPVAAPTGEVTG